MDADSCSRDTMDIHLRFRKNVGLTAKSRSAPI